MKYTMAQAALARAVRRPGEKMPPQKRRPNFGRPLLLITTLLLPRLVAHGGEGVPPQPMPPQVGQTETNTPPLLRRGGAGLSVRAENGYTDAQCQLAISLERTDEAAAMMWLRKAADAGNATAQCYLGNAYDDAYPEGWGLHKNPQEAVRWYRKAAENGDACAQCYLAAMYQHGSGVETNLQEAVRWYRKAAQKGYPLAQSNLGVLYSKGNGVETNLQEAVKWFTLAAEQGFASAQRNLGHCYDRGEGVPSNFVTSAEWYLRAAKQVDADAQFRLAIQHFHGQGVPSDFVTSAKWYLRAAKQGNAAAQALLAGQYVNGQGVPQDYVEAYKWANLAAVNGDSDTAAHLRVIFVEHMTPDQIAEAQRRLSAFIPQTENQPSDKFAESSPALVPKSTGTAFFISGNRYLLTAAHVVEGATRIVVNHGRKNLPAKLIKTDTANDLAVLKVALRYTLDFEIADELEVDWHTPALPLAASRSVKLGDSIFTIGFPNTNLQGTEPKLTKGEISSMSGIQDDPRDFQISAPIQPGNSGGPLVDLSGNVVGMVTSRLAEVATLQASGSPAGGITYALKSSFIVAFLETLAEPSAKLKEPRPPKERRFSEVVEEVKASVFLITVY